MKFSGWLSLAISVFSGLVFVGPAAAHVVASPSFVVGGKTSTLTFAAPNERDAPMTGFDITLPKGFEIRSAPASGAWRAEVTHLTVRWSGGQLPAKATQSFSLDVKAPAPTGVVDIRAVQTYPDGDIVGWPLSLTIVQGSKPSQNLGAALVAGVLGLLGVTGLVVFLWQRRVGSLQEK